MSVPDEDAESATPLASATSAQYCSWESSPSTILLPLRASTFCLPLNTMELPSRSVSVDSLPVVPLRMVL